MNINRYVMIPAFTLMTSPAHALDLVIQPRIDVGIMDYRLEVGPTAQRDFMPNFDISLSPNPLLNALGAEGPTNIEIFNGQSGIRIGNNMPFVNLGATVFYDRLYADLSYLRSFDGKGTSSLQQTSIQDVFSQGATILDGIEFSRFTQSGFADLDSSDEFDRDEFNFTIGYAVTEQFAVFSGYRRSTFNLDSRRRGSASQLTTLTSGDIVLLDTRFDAIYTDIFEANFKQRGPFIGTVYTIPIEGNTLRGAFNFNAAVTYLDAKLRASIQNPVFSEASLINSVTGEQLPLDDIPTPPELGDFNGDAIGISLGVGWRGLTPIEGLTYSIGINGYNYQFKADSPALFVDKISERAIRYQLGVAYQF